MSAALVLGERFNGPPGTANGGYAAGMLAAHVYAPVVEVTLRSPPPLGVALEVRDGDLYDGDLLVAQGRALDGLDVDAIPPWCGLDAARAAGEGALAAMVQDEHPFPTCFGCGPQAPPSALHNLAGPVAGRPGLFAVEWTPDPSLPRAPGGTVAPEIVWAALDCPTGFPGLRPGDGPHVLGRIAVRIDAPVPFGAAYTVSAWALGREGRRKLAGGALHDAGGALLALARATWIEIPAA